MKIVYCHHANRDTKGGMNENNGLTRLGKRDARLTAKLLHAAAQKEKFTAIYTADNFRCRLTAKMINKYLNLPIIIDNRLNEQDYKNNESWLETQARTRAFLTDIIAGAGNDDTVICVTSGLNVAAFIQLAFDLEITENAARIGVPACCPLVFNFDKNIKSHNF